LTMMMVIVVVESARERLNIRRRATELRI